MFRASKVGSSKHVPPRWAWTGWNGGRYLGPQQTVVRSMDPMRAPPFLDLCGGKFNQKNIIKHVFFGKDFSLPASRNSMLACFCCVTGFFPSFGGEKISDPIFFLYWIRKNPVGKIILVMPNLSGLLPAFFHQEDRAWLSSRFNRADGDCWNWCDRAYFRNSLHQNIAHSNIPLKTNIAIEIANSPLFTIGNTCSNGYTTYCPWKMMSGRLPLFFGSVKIRTGELSKLGGFNLPCPC